MPRKLEMVVCAACVMLMVMKVGVIGTMSGREAKKMVCLMKLRVWGSALAVYVADNDGCFMSSQMTDSGPHRRPPAWYGALEPYLTDTNEMRYCPEATSPAPPFGTGRPPNFAAWYVHDDAPGKAAVANWGCKTGDTGSFGLNAYVFSRAVTWPRSRELSRAPELDADVEADNWQTPDVKGAGNVPVLLDSTWPAALVNSTDQPPAEPAANSKGCMRVFCIDRHQGGVNGLFMDFSARKIGLKELWRLKWHRQFDTCGPWTTCGGAEPNDWPEWMRGFEDY